MAGPRQKINFFKNMVMEHIKLKGMKCTTTCKQIFYPITFLTPRVGSKGQNIFFLKVVARMKLSFSEKGHIACNEA